MMSRRVPKFQKGDKVVYRHKQEMGHVESDGDLDGGDYWYKIRFEAKRIETLLEDELELLGAEDASVQELSIAGKWGTLGTFRCALAIEKMTNESRSTLFSYRSQRILFQPHQYKPLLKLLDSFDRRLLIADEVGLGKTIEAGLILQEMESRAPAERILIVCPSRLRDKWREELARKFAQEFDIFDKNRLLEYIKRESEGERHRPLRAIISMQALRDDRLREQLEELNKIELVIIDEAHHARNPGTKTTKALGSLTGLGECVILLTATPLNLGNRDLFTLLQALRPTEFSSFAVFEKNLRTYRGIYQALSLIRTMKPENLPHIVQELGQIKDPLVAKLIHNLQQSPPRENQEWIEWERRVQELHPLASIVTRTRKREVQSHAAQRRSRVVTCTWTEEEYAAYDHFVGGKTQRGWPRGELRFGEIQRARRAASCLPAAIGYTATIPEETEEEWEDFAESAAPPPLAVTTPFHDSKYETLLELLREIQQEERGAKVLIFSFFVGTVEYLAESLKRDGFSTCFMHGGIPSTPLNPDSDERGKRIVQFKDDPQVQIMVSSEIGSEGLDFQFCHNLVNYDLPWNPMVVEQRIGRIDRFGQTANVLKISSIVVENSVEDRILSKLYERIGLFEKSIGAIESILGEKMREFQKWFASGNLTLQESECRVEQVARAIENQKAELQQLETRADELFGHDEYIRSELDRVGRLGRYLTPKSMFSLLEMFLNEHHPDAGFRDNKDETYLLRLTDSLRMDIRNAAPLARWVDRSRADNNKLRIAMDGEKAYEDKSIELINPSHPLLICALNKLKSRFEGNLAKLGSARLDLEPSASEEFQPGFYVIAGYVQEVKGIRARRIVDPVGFSLKQSSLMDRESGERMLYLVLEEGADWLESVPYSPLSEEIWNLLESEIRRRTKVLRERETEENEARYERRKSCLSAEFEIRFADREQRLKTLKENERSERIIRASQGQLDHLRADHQAKLEQLEQVRSTSVSYLPPFAVCLVHVRHVKGLTVIRG